MHASGVWLLLFPVLKEVVFSLSVFKLIQFCWTLSPDEIGREKYAVRSYFIVLPSFLFIREPSSCFPWNPEPLQKNLPFYGLQKDCRQGFFILCCHWISLSLLLFQRQNCHGDLGLFAYHGSLGPCRFPCARVVSLFPIWSCAFCSTIFGFLLHGCEAAWDGSAYILWLNYCSAAGCVPLPFLWITRGASVKGNKWIFFVLGNSDLYLLDYKSDSKYLFSVFSWLVHLLSYFFSFSLILQERRKIFKENIFLTVIKSFD